MDVLTNTTASKKNIKILVTKSYPEMFRAYDFVLMILR